MTELTAKQIEYLNGLNDKCEDMEFGNIVAELITKANEATGITVGTPVNAVNATKTLTISGVVVDGEKVTIGSDVYEFAADAAQTVSAEGNIPVDIEANTTKSSGTLTLATQPTSGDTMTIGGKVYTFVPVGTDTADGEISVGTDLATAKANVIASINGVDGISEPNEFVSISEFTVNDATITALAGGVAGDAIATTETFAAPGNIFGAGTLSGGADCSATNAVTALVAAITASDTEGVGAEDGAGDTVVLTADVAGVSGNSITISETMTNGAFAGGATTLSGGVDGTVGTLNQRMMDTSYEYRCIAANTISGKNWRRISLGSAY
jgi:hypothetical protein